MPKVKCSMAIQNNCFSRLKKFKMISSVCKSFLQSFKMYNIINSEIIKNKKKISALFSIFNA